MAYTPFDSDLFVSYGHLDDESDSDTAHWIGRFHQDLQRRVSQYLGASVDVWRDSRLQGNDQFPRAIDERLRHVAAMVSILSPRYLSSDWCRRELESFLEAAKGGNGTKGSPRSRLFKVIKTPVDLKAQPGTLQDLLGYKFYRRDESGRPRELPDYDPRPDAEKVYRARLDDLAWDLHLVLKELAERGEETGPLPSKAVYLAEAAADLAEARDDLRRELSARGYRVLPDRSLSWRAGPLIDAVNRDLDASCLSLHLMGGLYGFVPEGDTRSVQRIQFELARERRPNGSFHRLLWLPPGLENGDDRQRELIDTVEASLRTDATVEVLKTPLEGLKSFLLERLATPTVRSDRVTEKTGWIYLICEPRDREAVSPIREHLMRRGLCVDLPQMTGEQAEIRQDHEATLKDCDGVLIYHGTGSEGWLREKVRDLRRARGWGRSRPFVPQGIYLGPEPTPEKQGYANGEFVVMGNAREVALESFEPFLDPIAARAGVAA